MTWEEKEACRDEAVRELTATKREGIGKLVDLMDRYRFFTAGCEGHDQGECGAVCNALWQLWFERQEGSSPLSEESHTIVTLCKNLHLSSFPPINGTRGASRSRAILEKSGCRFTAEELEAVGQPVQEDRATRFCDGIPFGTEPADDAVARKVSKTVDTILDNSDHRLWTGGCSDDYAMMDDRAEFPCHEILQIPVRQEGKDADLIVLTDDNGGYTLMALSEEGTRSKPALYMSDRYVFAYSDLVFFITRYPQFRSSYVAAKNAKGLWGILSVREDRKRRSGNVIIVEKVCEFTYRSLDKAANSLRGRSGSFIGIRHPHFFTEIHI